MALEERPSYQPRLVRSTGNLYQILNPEEARNEIPQSGDNPVQNSTLIKYAVAPIHLASIGSNYFKSAQWYLLPLLTPSTS